MSHNPVALSRRALACAEAFYSRSPASGGETLARMVRIKRTSADIVRQGNNYGSMGTNYGSGDG